MGNEPADLRCTVKLCLNRRVVDAFFSNFVGRALRGELDGGTVLKWAQEEDPSGQTNKDPVPTWSVKDILGEGGGLTQGAPPKIIHQ